MHIDHDWHEYYRHEVLQLNMVDQIHKLMQRVSIRGDDLIQPLCDSIRELFSADIVMVLEIHGKTARIRGHIGLFQNRYPIPSNPYPLIEKFLSTDVVEWDATQERFTPVLQDYNVQHAVFFPVLSRDREIMGTISLYRCYDEPFSSDDKALLIDVATRIGDYWQLKRTRDQERAHLRLLESLSQEVLHLQTIKDRTDFRRAVVIALEKMFEANVVRLSLMRRAPLSSSTGVKRVASLAAAWDYRVTYDKDTWGMIVQESVDRYSWYIIQRPLIPLEVTVLRLAYQHVANFEERLSLTKELEYRATTDGLTQVTNRHAFFERIGGWLRDTGETEMSLVIFDVDNFKDINDTYGHMVGDNALIYLAQQVKRCMNGDESTVFARYAGDEFVLAQNAPPADLKALATRIFDRLRQNSFKEGDVEIPLTMSMGLARGVISTHEDIVKLIQKADQALYEAKRQGKNRLVASLGGP